MRRLLAITFLLAQPAGWKPPAVRIQADGELKGYVSTLNCVGAGISCSVGASVATVSVSGGGSGGGSPGGNNGNVQINSSGSFGAYTGTTCAYAVKSLDANGAATCTAAPAIPADISAARYVTTQAEAGLSAEAVLPTCNGTDKLTFNGTVISCATDQTGGGGGAPGGATYITQTADATLTGEQALSSLGTGLLKNTTVTGVLSIGASGTDYAPATSGSSLLKGNGAGGFSNAVSGTDYQAPISLPLSVANGGTNGTATPTNGGAAYGTGTALAYTPAGTSGQVLTSNGAAAPTWQAAPAGGGGSGTVLELTAADITNSTTTPSNIFTTPITSGNSYGFVCKIVTQGTATSLPRFNINGPTVSNVTFGTERFTTTSAQTLLVLQAFSAAAQTAACTTNCNATSLPTNIYGAFMATASGTLAFMVSSSTAGQAVIVRRGSFCVVY